MNQRITPPAILAGNSHVEAFCHMQYYGAHASDVKYIDRNSLMTKKHIVLLIWNSRDGVTPFNMFSEEFGIELQHVNFAQDVFDPRYRPKKGDMIWRDWTVAEAEATGLLSWERAARDYERLKHLTTAAELEAAGYQWNPLPMLQNIINGKEAYIKNRVDDLVGNKQPKFELVKEDWK
jgi:hypothetical protein